MSNIYGKFFHYLNKCSLNVELSQRFGSGVFECVLHGYVEWLRGYVEGLCGYVERLSGYVEGLRGYVEGSRPSCVVCVTACIR